ncbi:MAG: hypothetical protein BMS9Abin13_425 [Patescibacteria group bacterium]|nr:MAG: hypothetical protein BMS9Abin13_425 [Patescibacteria group bacterium]
MMRKKRNLASHVIGHELQVICCRRGASAVGRQVIKKLLKQ